MAADPQAFQASRRQVLAAGAGLGAALMTTPATALASLGGREPRFRVSLAQWSLHKLIYAGEIDNLDFAKEAKDMGFTAIEYVNGFFKDVFQELPMEFAVEAEALLNVTLEGAVG